MKSVLFKGLPDVLNQHFHAWHKNTVLGFVKEKEGLRILDVGCGYGRLSLPLIENYPRLDITGLDISEPYAGLYREKTGRPARVGSLEELPEDLGAFDYILCVTVLMYLDQEKLGKAVSNLLAHLNPEGRLILIEPHRSGYAFQTGFGIGTLLRNWIGQDPVDTRGRYFRAGEIETVFRQAGGSVLLERRMPVSSLFFLPLALSGRILPGGWVSGLCRCVSRRDAFWGRFNLPSIQVAYLIAKQRPPGPDVSPREDEGRRVGGLAKDRSIRGETIEP